MNNSTITNLCIFIGICIFSYLIFRNLNTTNSSYVEGMTTDTDASGNPPPPALPRPAPARDGRAASRPRRAGGRPWVASPRTWCVRPPARRQPRLRSRRATRRMSAGRSRDTCRIPCSPGRSPRAGRPRRARRS